MILHRIINKIKRVRALRNGDAYVKYIRKLGVEIGEGYFIPEPKQIEIDITRPSLVTIGNNVRLNIGFTLLTHDFGSGVFRNLYSEFIPSSGPVTIGNNVYFARHCTVLKGVSIGDNCIIGYGSVVVKSIPANSVAVGCPARVICSIDEYYNKRKRLCIDEAVIYAQSIIKRYGRQPVVSDFWEEFPLFVDKHNMSQYPDLPYKRQLGNAYGNWIKDDKAPFNGFEDFLKYVHSSFEK